MPHVYYWPPGSNRRTATCTVSDFELEQMEEEIRKYERWLKARRREKTGRR